jgi:phage-related minor tail protein
MQRCELADIGRKLDIGNELLKNLPEIKTILGSFVVEQREQNKDQREYNKRMDEHNTEQREHNKRMDEHNLRLEKILEKLAER